VVSLPKSNRTAEHAKLAKNYYWKCEQFQKAEIDARHMMDDPVGDRMHAFGILSDLDLPSAVLINPWRP
jgi:hypothetical protein